VKESVGPKVAATDLTCDSIAVATSSKDPFAEEPLRTNAAFTSIALCEQE
jgi:hypothetical protein